MYASSLFSACLSTPKYCHVYSSAVYLQTDPGAHSAPYTMGTGSFPGVERPGRGVDHPPHLVPRLKKE